MAHTPPATEEEPRERLAEPVREGMEQVVQAIFAEPPKQDWRYQSKRR